VRAGALGDVLLLRAAVAALKKAGSRVVLLAPEPSGRTLVGPGGSEVDALVPWDRVDLAGLMAGADDAPLPEPLRRELGAFDLALCYTRNAALARNLQRLVPVSLAWDPSPPAGGPHASLWLAEPLRRLGLGVEPGPPPCVATEPERAAAAAFRPRLPTAFAAVHPGSGSPGKNWPAPWFAELAGRLAGDQPFLAIEGPADDAAAAVVLEHPSAVPARGLPPRVLGALLSSSAVFVGNDSGVSHLAAAFGAPVVALFGPTDPALWKPLGARVRALRSESGRMEDLGIGQVEAACRSLRSAAAGPPGC
jgi:hypothetical protein